MPRIRFAILGCGNIGKRHIVQAKEYGELVAICDNKPSVLEGLNNELGLRCYSNLFELIDAERERVDVLAVCTPNAYHAEHSIAALDAGWNVLCEKPMALTSTDCGRMIQAAEKNSRRLFVVKQNRYNPPVQAVKSSLEDGKLGKVYSAHLNCYWNRNDDYYNSDWKGSRELDGGCLYTQFSHFIDLLYWLVGEVIQVQAFSETYAHSHNTEFEDSGVVSLRFANGALGSINYTTNSYSKNMEGSLTLFCEYGTVKIGGQYLNTVDYEDSREPLAVDSSIEVKPNDYGTYVGSMSNHGQVYENVVQVLSGDGVIATSGYEGMRVVEIIERIYRSDARRG